ncbi:proline-rich protein 2-like [Manis pentadactyla]|uniref:proline-rich protein 2-like n=1 Tax=Manis pentadactyla TaxID=143292 RepID=UPI00255CAAD8|nr:proline-rich protein 2-like [Manis pentadactyla]
MPHFSGATSHNIRPVSDPKGLRSTEYPLPQHPHPLHQRAHSGAHLGDRAALGAGEARGELGPALPRHPWQPKSLVSSVPDVPQPPLLNSRALLRNFCPGPTSPRIRGVDQSQPWGPAHSGGGDLRPLRSRSRNVSSSARWRPAGGASPPRLRRPAVAASSPPGCSRPVRPPWRERGYREMGSVQTRPLPPVGCSSPHPSLVAAAPPSGPRLQLWAYPLAALGTARLAVPEARSQPTSDDSPGNPRGRSLAGAPGPAGGETGCSDGPFRILAWE